MNLLYRLLILPIEYLIEVVFTVMNSFFGREGFAIIAVSVAISTLVLPLYLRADAIQEEEQEKQKKMERWLAHIKKHFSGDERYMMVNAYYAEMNYKPLYALRGLIPLFLQIPFFIAAFHFLSNMQRLQGCSFGPIADLGAEDGMLVIGGLAINVLPVMMTFFNVLSTVIYTRGFSWKQKLQPYLLALLFLVLLYHSPSGLVLYWMMNNLYSFLKNLITKTTKNPTVVVGGISFAGAAGILIFLIRSGKLQEKITVHDPEKLLLYFVFLGIVLLPCLRVVFQKLLRKYRKIPNPRSGCDTPSSVRSATRISKKSRSEFEEFPMIATGSPKQSLGAEEKEVSPGGETLKSLKAATGSPKQSLGAETPPYALVFAEELAFTVLMGAVIPLLVIAVCPLDFLALDRTTSPLHYVAFATTVSAGYFLVWGNIIYGLADGKGRRLFSEGLFVLMLVCLMNVMLFRANVGNVSAMLEFDILPRFVRRIKAINLLAIAAVLLLGHLFWRYAGKIRNSVVPVMLFSLCFMGGKDILSTYRSIQGVSMEEERVDYTLPFSKNGRNVLVIMLDRAIGGFIPYIMDEKPFLKEQFEGFTYYPNTLSFGTHTTTGAPGLYGGYDYTAVKRNLNATQLSKAEQHDQSLLTMPVLFGEEGYHVTVTDPPFVHWESVPDLEMFRQYPYITAFELRGTLPMGYSVEGYLKARERNFVFYSLFRCMPAFLQDEVYDTGGYLAADRNYFLGEESFREGYTTLQNMSEITEVRDDHENYFLDICNNTTHGAALLSLPDYRMDRMPDYSGIDIAADKEVDGKVLHFDRNDLSFNVGHYHSNMAALLVLGEYMERLKEWGIYDNTRIIIVSDHGFDLEQFDYMLFDNGVDVEAVNPLLLVKDFDCRDAFKTDGQFMMNADVPTLATQGLIEDPVNPFTGSPINMDGKKDGAVLWWPGGYAFKEVSFDGDRYSEPHWYHVQDDIFDEKNWTRLEVNEAEGRPLNPD